MPLEQGDLNIIKGLVDTQIANMNQSLNNNEVDDDFIEYEHEIKVNLYRLANIALHNTENTGTTTVNIDLQLASDINKEVDRLLDIEYGEAIKEYTKNKITNQLKAEKL